MIDITKIPKYLKSLLINSILLPFWITSIYIYHPQLYLTNDFLIIGSLSISLTIISSMIGVLAFVDTKKPEHLLQEYLVMANVAIQVILLSLVIFLGYISYLIFDKKFLFYGFLLTYFGILSLLALMNLINKK